MRKIYLTLLLGMSLLQGCDKFLDLKPDNVQVVSKIEDYRDLLASYMYYLKTTNPETDILILGGYNHPVFNSSDAFVYRTGELVPNTTNSAMYDPTLGEYTKSAVDKMTWMSSADGLWSGYYGFLGPINMIIGGIETAEGDDERLRDYVKGEALVWRAYSYLKLLQYYSPYKTGMEYGVPVYLKPYEDPGSAMPARETQQAVYDRIFADCDEVEKLMKRTPSTTWNYAYEPRFFYGMLAHIYWWKAMSVVADENDWKHALEYAEKALTGRVFTYNPQGYKDMFDVTGKKEFNSDEFYFRLLDGTNARIANLKNYYQAGNYSSAEKGPDPAFYAMFKADDVRKSTYFRTKLGGTLVFDKYNISADPMIDLLGGMSNFGGVIMLYRAAELQLIKAEALFRMNRTDEAKAALEEFKKGRYTDIEGSYTESDLLNEILKERKLEFYHEQDMWWLDMKRLGTRVERVINGTLYVIEPDDYRYCFPIPASEMEVNKNMVQNPGWDEINL